MANKTTTGVVGPKSTQQTTQTTQPKQAEKKFLDWDKEGVKEKLKEQIWIINNGRSNYLTLAKLASNYLMTSRTFRDKCNQDEELTNLLNIYNGVFVEHIMTEAIKTGKINAQTEDFLRNELQAFTGAGFEQHINWIADKGELVRRDNGEAFEIEVDVDKKPTKELLWDTNGN